MRTRRVLAVVASAFALVLWAAAPALAAPQRLSSDPEPGAELHEAPARVSIEFSEPLDDSSEIRISDDCGNRLDAGGTTVNLNEMSVGVAKTPSGTYLVQYLAAGLTGTAAESFTFTVLHAGPHCDGGTGHGDHDGHGKDDDNGHDGHGKDNDGHGRGDHGQNDHGGMDHGGDHGSGDHGGDHTMGGHAGHSGDKRHGSHGKKRGKGHHKDHGKGGKHAGHHSDEDPALAAPGDGLIPTDIPDGGTVLVALGLASVFGALGGWVLRISGP